MMDRIYLCGKISGLPWAHVKGKFKRLENKAFKMGFEPVNPIIHSNQNDSWEKNMKRCIGLMVTCDRLLVSSDYKTSKGANIEIDLAEKLGLKIIYE